MNRRTLLSLLASVAVFLGVVLFYARNAAPLVLLNALEQAVHLALYLGAAGLLGYGLLAAGRIKPASHALRLSSSVGLGMGILGLLELLLGLFGWLSGTSMWILLAASALAGFPAMRSRPGEAKRRELAATLRHPIPLPGLWPVVAAYAAVAVVGASILPGLLWKPDDPHPYDVLIYHLQVPREWYELGRIVPLEHNVYSFFPFNVEIHSLAMMHLRGGPWAAMYEVQYLSLAFTWLTAITLYGVLQAVSTRAGALAAATFLLVPWVTMLSCIAYVEAGLMFYAALAIAWLMPALRENGSLRTYATAGVFSGLAAGVKLTSLAMLTAPVGLFLLAWSILSPRQQLRSRLAGTVVFGLLTLLTVSPWLIRNQIWSGNPVFPLAMRQLGAGGFSEDQVIRFERAHKAPPERATLSGRLATAGEHIGLDWRFGILLLPMALGGLAFARAPHRRLAALCGVVLLGTTLIWLFATHLQSRFFVIALPATAILIGLWPERTLRWAAAAVLLSALGGLTGFTVGGPSTSRTGLHAALSQWTQQTALFALPDPSPLFAEAPYAPALAAGDRVLFVGDAQIFWQTAPMSQLRYRTVFNVDAAGRSLIDAWYGPPTEKVPADIVPVLSDSELRRLHNTYYAIPPLTPDALRGHPRAMRTP